MWSAIAMAAILMAFQVIHVHGKYVYSTQALEKERNSERRDSIKKGERSSMLLCCTRMHTIV